MSTPEAKVKARIKKALNELGRCTYFMPPASIYGQAGVSDIIVCRNGLFVAVEAKAKRGKPTRLQIKFLERVAASGGLGMVVWPHKVQVFKPYEPENPLTHEVNDSYKRMVVEIIYFSTP